MLATSGRYLRGPVVGTVSCNGPVFRQCLHYSISLGLGRSHDRVIQSLSPARQFNFISIPTSSQDAIGTQIPSSFFIFASSSSTLDPPPDIYFAARSSVDVAPAFSSASASAESSRRFALSSIRSKAEIDAELDMPAFLASRLSMSLTSLSCICRIWSAF